MNEATKPVPNGTEEEGTGATAPVIRTEGLTKLYPGSGRGCRNVSLQVEAGQIFGFLGPNGAGKSTFVKMLVGLIRPTRGEARLFGLPLGHLEAKRRIGYLPELYRYQDWLTGDEVLRLHAKLCRMPAERAERRIRELVAEVGLAGRSRERVRHYSKGMQQRLGLACALLDDPELLFLDEPSSAMDPLGRHEVRELLAGLKRQGKTVFLNTHLLEDVEQLCDSVALLFDGEIRDSGQLADIMNRDRQWHIRVGGYYAEVLDEVREAAALTIETVREEPDGTAVLRVRDIHEEQVGWLNRMLMEYGFTLYEAKPVLNKLDDWFIRAAKGGRDADGAGRRTE